MRISTRLLVPIALAVLIAGAAPAFSQSAPPGEPQGAAAERTPLERGRQLLAKRRYAEAAPLLRRAARDAPEDFGVQMDLARALRYTGAHEEGIGVVEKALALRPKDAGARSLLGVLHSYLGHSEVALAHLRESLSLDPKNHDARVAYARVLSWTGDYDGALAQLDTVLAAIPNSVDAREARARILSWQGRYEESIALFKAVLEDAPKYRDVRLALLRVYLWARKTDEGLELVNRWLKQAPRDVDYLRLRAELFVAARDLDGSIAAYEKLLEVADDAEARARLGILYSSAQRYQDAVIQLENSLAERSDNVETLVTLGRIYGWRKRLEEADDLFRRAHEKSPDNPEVLLGWGAIKYYAGDWAGARELYEDARARAPHSPEALRAIRRLDMAEAPRLILGYRRFEAATWDSARHRYSGKFVQQQASAEVSLRLSSITSVGARVEDGQYKDSPDTRDTPLLNKGFTTGSLSLRQDFAGAFQLYTRAGWRDYRARGASRQRLNDGNLFGFGILRWETGPARLSAGFERDLTPISRRDNRAALKETDTWSLTALWNPVEEIELQVGGRYDPRLSFNRDLDRRTGLARAAYRPDFAAGLELSGEFRASTHPTAYESAWELRYRRRFGDVDLSAAYAFEYLVDKTAFARDGLPRHRVEFSLAWAVADAVLLEIEGRGSKRVYRNRDWTLSGQAFVSIRFP